jgi:hypothetical protein
LLGPVEASGIPRHQWVGYPEWTSRQQEAVVADRNFWDPPTPPGSTTFTKHGLVVDLCTYVLEHSVKDERAVQADVEEASKIWCQGDSGINIQAAVFFKFPPLPPSEPLDLRSPDLAGQIFCNALSGAAGDQILNIPRPGCADLTRSIAVFYVPGARLGGGAIGCHHFRVKSVDGRPEHFIVLSDEADGKLLAHEVGHALLVRETVPNTWINDDPDPNGDPADKVHDKDPQNLMFPSVPNDPDISPPQGAQARESLLTRGEDLAFGFRENKPFTLGVTFKKLIVHSSSDEATSDDALESSWNFKVSVVRTDESVVATETRTWTRDPLHWWTYDLTDPDVANVGLPVLQLSADTDTLAVEVTGTDEDFGPDDNLPSVVKAWERAESNWGSDVVDPSVPGGQKGDHLERRTDGNIDYELVYNTSVVDQPKEQVFRDPARIC